LTLAFDSCNFTWINQITNIIRAFRLIILIAAVPILLGTCKKDCRKITSKDCLIDIDTFDFTFGIDYIDTLKYMIPGEQSNLNDYYLEEIRSAVGTPENNIESILDICRWIDQNFSFQNAGGAMIGKITVDELYASKTYYGCHSHALLVSSILREFGFPAIMIETADVGWAYSYNSGTTDNFAGHVMSEIYVENRWILLDNNCTYVKGYDQTNPFIPSLYNSNDSYFVFAKGIDTWDYSEKDESFTIDNMIFFSENIYCFEKMFNTVSYYWSN